MIVVVVDGLDGQVGRSEDGGEEDVGDVMVTIANSC